MNITVRSNGTLIKKKPFKVLVCLVTLMAFLCNTVLFDVAWAVGTPSTLTGRGVDRAGGSGFVKDLNVNTFTLPEYLGHIKDSYKIGSDKVVIHIQDAHCNYAAQHKIAEIVEYMNKEYGINTINLEGGAKDYDLSIFTKISDKTIRDKVTDYFVKEGLVNGAEYFAINNPQKSTLWGIEDPGLYINNLKAYRDSLKYKDEVDKHINALTNILSNLKTKIYSQKLLESDTKYSQYKAGGLEFKTYLSYLIETAKEKAIDVKFFKNICRLNQTLMAEGAVNFKEANNQRDNLIDRLQKRLSKNEIEELVLKTIEFKSERISQKDFYAYLVSKAKSINVGLSEFPELQKYIVYISAYGAVDKITVMDEVTSLEDKIKQALYRNDDERQLSQLSKNLALIKNLFNISLTPDDYKYYKANESSFAIINYTSFISRQAPLYHITAKLDETITSLDAYRIDAARFYECSFKRDGAFIENIKFQRKTVNQKMRNAILITGGFHTENLYGMFRKQGMSYISIMPNFKNGANYECPYFSLLAGNRNNPVERKITTLLAFSMAVVSPFTALNKVVKENVGESYSINEIQLELEWAAAQAEGKKGVVVKCGANVLGAIGEKDKPIIIADDWKGMSEGEQRAFKVIYVTQFVPQLFAPTKSVNMSQLPPAAGMIPFLRYVLGEKNAQIYQADIEQIVGWTATICLKLGVTTAFSCAPIIGAIASSVIVWGFFIFAHTEAFARIFNRVRVFFGLKPANLSLIPRAYIIGASLIAFMNVITIIPPLSFQFMNFFAIFGLFIGFTGTTIAHDEANHRYIWRTSSQSNKNIAVPDELEQEHKMSRLAFIKLMSLPVITWAWMTFALNKWIAQDIMTLPSDIHAQLDFVGELSRDIQDEKHPNAGVIKEMVESFQEDVRHYKERFLSTKSEAVGAVQYELDGDGKVIDYYLMLNIEFLCGIKQRIEYMTKRAKLFRERDSKDKEQECLYAAYLYKTFAKGILVKESVHYKQAKTDPYFLRQMHRTKARLQYILSKESGDRSEEIKFLTYSLRVQQIAGEAEGYQAELKYLMDQGLTDKWITKMAYLESEANEQDRNIRVVTGTIHPLLIAWGYVFDANGKLTSDLSKMRLAVFIMLGGRLSSKIIQFLMDEKYLKPTIPERPETDLHETPSAHPAEGSVILPSVVVAAAPAAPRPTAVRPQAAESKTKSPVAKALSNSLIGKLLDSESNIITSFSVAQKDDVSILIKHNSQTLAEVSLAVDITVDKNVLVDKLTHLLSSRKANLPLHAQDTINQLIEKIKSVNAVVALERHKDVKGAFYETNGQYTLYLNKDILNNLLGLIHELGEGSVILPRGYKNLMCHTMMRGVGKDVRNAFDALGTTETSAAKTAGELIKMLEKAMKIEGFAMSNNRSRDSPMTKSEKDLIRLNFKNGLKSKESLFGVQDFLTIEGNTRFTQDIRNINRDLRQGVLNIFLMRSRIDTKSAETSVGREMGRKLEKNLGINTQMLYFEDNDSLAEQLAKAINYATSQENRDKLPKIFVDCLTEDDWKSVNAFKDSKRQELPSIDSIIAVGRDFIEGEEPKELPDEVKVILVGSAIMNDRRLKDNFKMSSEDLLEGRRHIIDFLISNKIIDTVTITNDQIDMFFNDLWKGIKRLLITRINWKEFQDWKNSQDEVLRAL